MRLIYILPFDIDNAGGRNMVSKEKYLALRRILGSENVAAWYPHQNQKSKIKKYFTNITFDIICAKRLLRLPSNGSYSVIYRVMLFPLSHWVMKLKKIKCVYEVHADFPNEIKHLQKKRIEEWLLNMLVYFDKMNFKWSNGIIYNHPVLMAALSSKYPKPSIYTYNAVNTDSIRPVDKSIAREKLGINSHEKIALFIGSVSKWHGVHYLVESFNNEKLKQDINARLYIVGTTDTPYVAMLKEIADNNENIVFVNHVPPESARLYINASDVCLLPVADIRTSPGSPIKLYEYIACGKPVLSQENMLGYSDEIINYQLGATTDFTLASKAANDIYAMLNKDDYVFYQTNNVNRARTDLSWKNRMQQWINFVNELQ